MHFATEFWLTRFCFQHALGGIYLIAFLAAANQFIPLLGERGLQPVRRFVQHVPFRRAPSLFYINCADSFIATAIWFGVALSIFATTGFSESFGLAVSVLTWGLLWVIYLSLVNVGQTFYGFGWETMLCETGFLAIFLGSADSPVPVIVIWLIVWVLFRTIFGAGMIKMRSDPCWRDLTCLFYHYETQPLPNPLSWYLHRSPRWTHKAGVLFTHFAQLFVPWFYFAPAPLCYWAGAITIAFQLTLILSGNLSWLNYLTIVLCIPCFDDRFLARFVHVMSHVDKTAQVSLPHAVAIGAVTTIVVALSWRPARNLFSRRQLMNASFEPLHLVNTYGAFGAVTRERLEVVIRGTAAEFVNGSVEWREYEFKGKPGDVNRRPCIVSPYHWRLDWQMWFAAMSPPEFHPWIFALLQRLLEGDKKILRLLARNPFPNAPPKFIRADWYRYQFTQPGERAWWTRTYVSDYLPPMTLRHTSSDVHPPT
ncbi:MAG: lipase maturation factor family protein [Alphaproteobacteria bacterium]